MSVWCASLQDMATDEDFTRVIRATRVSRGEP